MKSYPEWVSQLTSSDLERRFGAGTLGRAAEYQRQARVSQIQSVDTLVMATVRGSGFRTYHTVVNCPDGPGSLQSTCSCPVGVNCKHGAAVILQMQAVQRRRAQPRWQQALNPILTDDPASTPDKAPLALQVNHSRLGYWCRPMRPGARGNWIKTGASWSEVRTSPARFADAQREALVDLYEAQRFSDFGYYNHSDDSLRFSALLPDMWRVLRMALLAGVPLVAGNDERGRPLPQPALLDDPAVPLITIESAAGGLRVQKVLVSGPGRTQLPPGAELIGSPAHGLAVRTDDRLLFGPLDQPLTRNEHRLFTESDRLEVPADEVELFALGYLPRLRQRFEVQVADDVVLPEPSPPTLLCDVTFQPASARVAWSFRYELAGRSAEVGFAPASSDPPIRDHRAEAELVASLPDGAGRAAISLLTGRELFDFVERVLPLLAEHPNVEVRSNEAAPSYREAAEPPRIELTVTDAPSGDWFNLDVLVSVGDEPVPFAPLFSALSLGQDWLLLESGTWFSLDRPELDQLRTLIDEARLLVDHENQTFQLRPEHAGLWDELVRLGVVAEQSAAWRRSVGALLDLTELPDTTVPAGLRAELRPYQRTGFGWLSFLSRAGLGGILADEMGLGKTLQALALAQSQLEAGELRRPMLVVAPTSVLGTWAGEAVRFTPDLEVVTITQTMARRGRPLAEAVAGANLVLTSYTLLRLEAEDYQRIEWSTVLLDEAQFVKNHASKAYQAVRRLPARHKMALTGTPLENNLMDLWSLLSITAPGLFPDPKVFTELYRRPIESGDADQLARLQRLTRPLMLRRTKEAVATELPAKQEQIVPVELAASHRRLYDRHLARERQKVLGLIGDLQRNRITILRSLTLLRQLSLSPRLVDQGYPVVSAKIDTLLELLAEVIDGGHRALVFSQFTGFLALVRQRLDAAHIGYSYLDGRTRNRAERIDAFRAGDDPVFLISLKAGGFGLTLTEADYVFILDPWWNPAAESQAIDRTHRIGQDKPVNIYRLVSADTIEEKVVALQQRKRDLFDQVVGSASDLAAPPLGVAEIKALLEAD